MMTIEDIPQGAFVCELVGQYLDLSLSSLSLTSKARQAIDSAAAAADDDDETRFNTFLDSHIMPLSMWETPLPQGRPPVSSILDTSDSTRGAGTHPEIVLIDIPESEGAVIGLNGDSDVLSVSETGADHPVTSSSSTEREAGPLESTESDSTAEQLADSWKGQICIDCNTFGNIARFIQHRPKDTKVKKTTTGSVQSQSEPLLIRRLVYNNAGDRRYPKLALFAAVRIPADTELLI